MGGGREGGRAGDACMGGINSAGGLGGGGRAGGQAKVGEWRPTSDKTLVGTQWAPPYAAQSSTLALTPHASAHCEQVKVACIVF